MSDSPTLDGLTGIAVVGMAGRFPGAENISAFWRNLRDGVESIRFFSDEELEAEGVDPEQIRQPNYVKARGVLEGADFFAGPFFGIAPREARVMDPQHRIFLECAWEALEDAGYVPQAVDASIGVFAGSSINSYLIHNLGTGAFDFLAGLELQIGTEKDFLATRVSYKLNLRGPSVVIQSACSTSLVAVCQACQSLLNYQCDMALAGGVSVSVPLRAGSVHQEGGIVSPDGHCRPFDANAQGIVAGNGVGIVVLKRLAQAFEDGDTIHAVIKGFAVNNDGSEKVGYTAPSVDAQCEVIALAQALSDVSADTITYVECHGTGTPLGDPIEIAALSQAFRGTTDKRGFCAIGSVKSNVGHLDAAAGVTGLIKTALALEHGEIPPSLHYQSPNPKIDFASSPFYVNTALADWRGGATPRRAGVSSFGMGGTNAHVVLEEAPAPKSSDPVRPDQLLLLSARTNTALDAATTRLADALRSGAETNLADVAYTLMVGRKRFAHRRMLVCREVRDAVHALEKLDPNRVITAHQELSERPVVFMFPGQGVQYTNMGLGLYEAEPKFREIIDQCAELLRPELGCDLREVLYPGEADAEDAQQRLTQTQFTQPALFVVEYALARLWMDWGVRPEAFIGHSIGEYVAASLAGVLSLDDALQLVASRGQMMQGMPAGAMAAVSLAPETLESMMGEDISLAAVNELGVAVVSGPADAVDRLESQLAEGNTRCQRLRTSHAFHSSMMDPILGSFSEVLNQVSLRAPQIPYISNLTGTWITEAEATDPDYWVAHLRQTVLFAAGMQELLKDPQRAFVEIGPGATLSSLARRHPDRDDTHVFIPAMSHRDDRQADVSILLGSLGRAWLSGVRVDWQSFYAQERRRRVPLPTYPFERQRYWIEPDNHSNAVRHPANRSKRADMAKWFYVPSWRRTAAPISLPARRESPAAHTWLVFADDRGMGDALARQLAGRGDTVTIVAKGEGFACSRDGGYTLDPGEPEHYRRLFNALRETKQIPGKIVHLWGVTGRIEYNGGDVLERLLDSCFYSLVHVGQALGNISAGDRVDITIVTDHMQDVAGGDLLYPHKATTLGPCLVMPQENQNVTCKSVDFAIPDADSSKQADFVELLLAEVDAELADAVIAYRDGQRWVRSNEPVRLDGLAGLPARLRSGGVYLVTGGIGGIGFTLAEHLSNATKARLILVTRRSFPGRDDWDDWLASHPLNDTVSDKIRRIREMETSGAEVSVVSADVADRRQMRSVAAHARERYGTIHGVIHCAGVPSGGLIQLKTQESAAAVLASKVQGTVVLDEVFREDTLDFMLFCSSLTAITGSPGQVDYTAANAFLDAFAQWRNEPGTRYTVSIDWDAWSEVGMAVDTDVPEQLAEQRRVNLKNGISCEEGVEIFDRVLSTTLPQVAVSTRDLIARLEAAASIRSTEEAVNQENASPEPSRHPRPAMADAYVAPRNGLEATIAGIWQELFGLERVGVDDNFFDLGGHSLLAIQIISRLGGEFQVELAVNHFFEAPTVAQLAHLVEQGRRQKERDDEKIAEVLETVERLSEEEIQRLLTEKGLQT